LLAGSPTRVIQRVWRPLCLAALNVELADASGQILLNVLRDSLGGEPAAADLLVPRVDLARLFPEAAWHALESGGAQVHLRSPVTALRRDGPMQWSLQTRDGLIAADAVVLALPPRPAAALLASTALPALQSALEALEAIESAPIATIYLRYREDRRLPAPMIALLDDPARHRFGQWVFDRGALDAACAGVLSVVVSGSGPHRALDREALAAAVADQLAVDLNLPPPLASYVVVEKHATLRARPGLQRPGPELATGLFLAGDAAESAYPSTIEGSVRAGVTAAQAWMKFSGSPERQRRLPPRAQ